MGKHSYLHRKLTKAHDSSPKLACCQQDKSAPEPAPPAPVPVAKASIVKTDTV